MSPAKAVGGAIWPIGLVVVALVVAGGAVAVALGARRWQRETAALRARLDAARTGHARAIVDFRELDPLPPPVQRYFRAVLRDGQPVVAAAHLRHSGTFNLSATGEQWKPFTSDQVVTTSRPGFDWNARIAAMPGVPVFVHDAYVAGEGILHAAPLGLFAVADERGGRDLAEGELMRYFAEAAWYPTALLPGQGVSWAALDSTSALATLADGDVRLTLRFTFGDGGLIDRVRADARGRIVDGVAIPTPWEGRFWKYEAQGGMLVPTEGEVAWVLRDGLKPYWRGRLTTVAYEFARDTP